MNAFIALPRFLHLLKTPLLTACLVVMLTSTSESDWPQWRGPARDGHADADGLLTAWPDGGPELVWMQSGFGRGYGSVSIIGDRLYTMGEFGAREEGEDDEQSAGDSFAFCINSQGQILWKTRIGKAGAPGWGDFAGPRATPTVVADKVIVLGHYGELVCLSASTGAEIWRKDFLRDFAGELPEWGFSESPLVDGNQVIVTPGGSQGTLAAVDLNSGELLWRSAEATDNAHYSSVVMAEIEGIKQYVQLTGDSVISVAPQDGRLLWQAPRSGKVAVCPTPIVSENYVYVASGYGTGCNLFEISRTGNSFSAEQVYANKQMVNHHGGVIKVGDYLYGYSDKKGLTCQEFLTGKVVWRDKRKINKGCLTYAEGMLYCREEESGTMILVVATPDGYDEQGRFEQPERAAERAWAHPTLADGKLYLRDQDNLFCYNVSQPAGESPAASRSRRRHDNQSFVSTP